MQLLRESIGQNGLWNGICDVQCYQAAWKQLLQSGDIVAMITGLWFWWGLALLNVSVFCLCNCIIKCCPVLHYGMVEQRLLELMQICLDIMCHGILKTNYPIGVYWSRCMGSASGPTWRSRVKKFWWVTWVWSTLGMGEREGTESGFVQSFSLGLLTTFLWLEKRIDTRVVFFFFFLIGWFEIQAQLSFKCFPY